MATSTWHSIQIGYNPDTWALYSGSFFPPNLIADSSHRSSSRGDAADAGYTIISITMIISNGGASTPKRGAFILLEGVDRCGKTTQVSLLVKHLLSLSIATVALRFPDRTTQGEFNANAAMLSFDHHVLGNGMHIFLHKPNSLLMFN